MHASMPKPLAADYAYTKKIVKNGAVQLLILTYIIELTFLYKCLSKLQ